jgi:LemA protein
VLGAAIGRLMVVAEQYPELRATENFQQLQAQLSETEDQIQITRRVYNDTVQTYNTSIQVFPAVLVANAFNFTKRDFFDAPKDSEAVPEVSFGAGDAPTGEAPAK